MISKIKAVIFDLDGTLINSIDYHHQAYIKALKNTGVELTKNDFIKLLGIPAKELLELVLQKHCKAHLLTKIYNKKYKYADAHPEKVLLNNNAIKILKWLKKNNIKIALATSSSKSFTNKILKHHNIKNYFDVILTWEDIKKPKPNPDIFINAAKKLGINKNQCILIEDAEIGFMAGKASGIKTYGLVGTNSADKIKKMEVDGIINDLIEIKKLIIK